MIPKDGILTASTLANLLDAQALDAPLVVVDDVEGFVPLALEFQRIYETGTRRVIAVALRGSRDPGAFKVRQTINANLGDARTVSNQTF